ncbi:dTDP-D-glucose 4,6-dehydratase [Bradyrhizobium sp. LB9.1b]
MATAEIIRDWLHVDDHAAGLIRLLYEGRPGEKYNFGGDSQRSNLEVVTRICDVLDRLSPGAGVRRSLIAFVPDRPGHDSRYAVDASKAHRELGWEPTRAFEQGLAETVGWYLKNRAWWERARCGVYDGSRLGLLAVQH